ncbi:HlyD family efflux transporter periplasmic adaptor subunit [Alkaliphilus hydrothermalis]|uniref:HlyD family secretion protein n=1 Tax=Alkaliphilus hydrothermalis TaxID=1482730 RepID=A0ABS2NQ34_9FIRM|nr:HlyD family efflux transporter periplasmic adaptor subunit [Alkaliphilus hydrothermalis]MBM7615043.1 HlyD family secretion protein [Alkaliphilus hydrothermalis]
MKGIIQDISEITDSKEVMLGKPHPFMAIFIYLIIGILVITLGWSYYGEIDIYVKTNGVVRPQETVSTITNQVTGNVKEVHYEDGEKVNAGDILYTIDVEKFLLERDVLKKELSTSQQEYDNLNKLRKSVMDGKNYFDPNVEEENDYYNKFLKYQTDLEIELRRSELAAKQYEEVSNTLENLKLLRDSILANSNLVDSSNTVYFTKFEDYKFNIQRFEDTLLQQEAAYNTSKALGELGAIPQKEVEDAGKLVKSTQLELEKYKNEYLLSINTSIDSNEKTISELEINLRSASGASSGQGLIPQKHKMDNLVQIEENIKAYESRIKNLERDLESIEINIADAVVKAPQSGTINGKVEMAEGDFLQTGMQVLTILPQSESQYKIQLYVSNKDIAGIKVGDEVKYHFLALPYREYGALTGKITRISTDARVDDQSGMSFYLVEASVENRPLFSYKGEMAEIKVGMMAEAQVITGSKKILYHLLEKIDLRD